MESGRRATATWHPEGAAAVTHRAVAKVAQAGSQSAPDLHDRQVLEYLRAVLDERT